MSFFEKIFRGGKDKKKLATPAEAIQRLKKIEDMLEKKQEYLERKIDEEKSNAVKLKIRDKKAALLALKRKKRYELQLKQIDGTLTTLEYQRDALENASCNTDVLKVMGVAARALKNTHKEIDVEEVHGLMDNIQEQQDIAAEIAGAISTPTVTDDYSEEDLLRELQLLEDEELKLPDVGTLSVEPPARREKSRSGHPKEDKDKTALASSAS